MKIRTSYTGASYITAGKIYDAEIVDKDTVEIVNDDGNRRIVKLTNSFTLDGHDWEIVQAEYFHETLSQIAGHVVDALRLAQAASRRSDAALERALAKALIDPLEKLHARAYELAEASRPTNSPQSPPTN